MQALRDYLKQVSDKYSTGEAKEHAYRAALGGLLESYGGKGVQALNDSLRIACGSPDFIVLRKDVPLGYAEAKDIGVDLAKTEKDEQLKRYREALSNLILTDYLEFRWYSSGELKLSARIGKADGKKIKPAPDGMSELDLLLKTFIDAQTPTVGRPGDLAKRMARTAQLIRSVIQRAFDAEETDNSPDDPLHSQFESFRETLLDTLTKEQFADMYAQTICYGMFAARAEHAGPRRKGDGAFTRFTAAHYLPRTNPFLRKLFGHIAGPELDERISWAVDDLAELLRRADMAGILSEFGARKGGEDPVVHFYETFLAAYDPKLRESRGVYYTPEAVVGYIVRSVDEILRLDFGLKDGLANKEMVEWPPGRAPVSGRAADGAQGRAPSHVHKVQILDPAVGTGSFLFGVVDQIRKSFKGREGQWSAYVREHLLPRLHGFELLMAPYSVAHLKLGLQLAETGYEFDSDERLSVFLTNTLDEPHLLPSLGAFGNWLSEEAAAANRVKRDLPVLVVLGNPPYSGHSANKGNWVGKLVRDYREGIPELNKPAQAKWLSDDYVKFIRWAQWRIDRTGGGVLAMITNHGYLDNPTFRGMRQSLMKSFDRLYILDLHGNSKKKERVPEDVQSALGIGPEDKNVFDIQQGVAICVMVKLPVGTPHGASAVGAAPVPPADAAGRVPTTGGACPAPTNRVFHASLWGNREQKYAGLNSQSAGSLDWQALDPQGPAYLFVPSGALQTDGYEAFASLRDIFSPNGNPAPGIVTTHDSFAISWSAEEAISKVAVLLNTSTEDEARRAFRLCSQSQWSYSRAKLELASGVFRNQVTKIHYRPFDVRFTIYNPNVAVHRRERVSRHMRASNGNLALVTVPKFPPTNDPTYFFAVKDLIVNGTIRSDNQSIDFLFPLYLYPTKPGEARTSAPGGRRPNLAPDFIAECERRWGLAFVPDGQGDLKNTFGPEYLFHYMYAVFHSPEYRRRYADFLKRDFPRLPVITVTVPSGADGSVRHSDAGTAARATGRMKDAGTAARATGRLDFLRQLCALGGQLTALHLMREGAVDEARFPLPGFPVAAPKESDRLVEKVRFTPPSAESPVAATSVAGKTAAKAAATGATGLGKVWINKTQFFDGVAAETWDFHIGGYQVCEKWLKDRKGRLLSSDDIDHYRLVCATLAQTRALMGEIDALIEKHGGWPLG